MVKITIFLDIIHHPSVIKNTTFRRLDSATSSVNALSPINRANFIYDGDRMQCLKRRVLIKLREW
jgi:hypothetical protein